MMKEGYWKEERGTNRNDSANASTQRYEGPHCNRNEWACCSASTVWWTHTETPSIAAVPFTLAQSAGGGMTLCTS